MIHKPGKISLDVSFYRSMSLLLTNSKLLGKIILIKETNKILNPQDWIPHQKSEFRHSQSTEQQCNHIRDVINKVMEIRQYCTVTFRDVNQAFDKLWHPVLLFKIKRILPSRLINLMKSYLFQSDIPLQIYIIKLNIP